MALKCSNRSDLSPFVVMDMMDKAVMMENQNINVIHLEAGQPSTGAPAAASRAIIDAVSNPANHGYTLPHGSEALRRGIARHYKRCHNLDVNADNVIVTVGSSLGFAMSFLTCFEHGDRVVITNPGYSAYRNLMIAVGVEPVSISAGPEQNWSPRIEDIAALDPLPDGLIITNPSNPTGVVMPVEDMKALAIWCHDNGVRLISDEIYHGITFDVEATTAIAYSPSAIAVNSFSKYFSMTGHRVGWMVAPDDLVDRLVCIGSNMVISVPTLSQIAATTAITDEQALAELETHVSRYRDNRDILLNELSEKILGNVAPPQGAFYIYADTSRISNDSAQLAERLLNEAHVATTSGLDFDPEHGHLALRFSYAGSTEDMKEGVRRINAWVADHT